MHTRRDGGDPVPDEVLERAHAAAAAVVDPELPMVTLADLGVLRSVETAGGGTVVVTLRPTYTGCPATAAMATDVRRALASAGFVDVEVRTDLAPWTTDDITASGRVALREHGVAPPGPAAGAAAGGPVDLVLLPAPPAPACPRCGSPETRELSRHGSSPCLSLHVCSACAEPFEKVKEK